MAKLQSYYVLCPLIDQKSFLGISDDKEDETVIVTLGRNVVNKYRLSDQKQTGGWTSKDHITAPVIYDHKNNCYVGVFNNNTIKMWKEDTDNLDKVKKYKFAIQILRVLPNLIIFANGNCAALTYAIENRKSYDGKAAIKDSEDIVAVQASKAQNHICYVVKNNASYEIVHCPLRVELGDMEKSKLSRTKIARPEEVHVAGYHIHADENTVYVLWSDSKLTSYSLTKKSWNTVGTVPWVSAAGPVSLAWMGRHHIVAFGTNQQQDGAIIVAYNVILGIGSYRYPMKMYTSQAKFYCFDDRIILEASNHIGILPYVIEEKRHISSLLGSHEIVENDCLEIADWGTPTTLPGETCKETEKFVKQGISERTICAQVITNLVDSNAGCERIVDVLATFRDIPESVIVLLINHVMKKVNGDADLSINDQVASATSEYVSEMQLLDYLFGLTFCDSLLISHLRVAVSLDNALFLLSYIAFLLKTDIEIEEQRLLDWCAILMDAFYQQYLITKDEKVTEVLKRMQAVVKELIQDLWIINGTITYMHNLLYGKKSDDVVEEIPYYIELMQI